MSLRATTRQARNLLSYFRNLAEQAGIPTTGVRLSISERNRTPHQVGGVVYLPILPGDLYRRSFLHELQHARDFLDGVDLPIEEMERRARVAEIL